MSVSDFVRTSVHGSIVLTDGAAVPNVLTVPFDLGDVSITGLSGPKLNEVVDHEARGHWISDSYGARRYVQITFTSYLTGEGASGDGSVQAFLTQSPPYTGNVSIQGAGRPYAVKFTLNIEGDDFGADDWSTIFNNCSPTDLGLNEGMDGDKWSIGLKCRGAVTGSIAADEID